MNAVVIHDDEIGFVVPEVAHRVGVLDAEAELFGQFGEAGYVVGYFQKLRELKLELVFTRDEVKDALLRRSFRTLFW